jgi:hypothetical protein
LAFFDYNFFGNKYFGNIFGNIKKNIKKFGNIKKKYFVYGRTVLPNFLIRVLASKYNYLIDAFDGSRSIIINL